MAASIIGEAQRPVNRSRTGPDKKILRKLEAFRVVISGFWTEFGERALHPADISGSGFGTPIAVVIMFERERLEAEARRSVKDVRNQTGRSSAGNRRATLRTAPGMGPFWEASDWPLRAEGHLSGRGDGPKALRCT